MSENPNQVLAQTLDEESSIDEPPASERFQWVGQASTVLMEKMVALMAAKHHVEIALPDLKLEPLVRKWTRFWLRDVLQEFTGEKTQADSVLIEQTRKSLKASFSQLFYIKSEGEQDNKIDDKQELWAVYLREQIIRLQQEMIGRKVNNPEIASRLDTLVASLLAAEQEWHKFEVIWRRFYRSKVVADTGEITKKRLAVNPLDLWERGEFSDQWDFLRYIYSRSVGLGATPRFKSDFLAELREALAMSPILVDESSVSADQLVASIFYGDLY